jgi:hypothetical protein
VEFASLSGLSKPTVHDCDGVDGDVEVHGMGSVIRSARMVKERMVRGSQEELSRREWVRRR